MKTSLWEIARSQKTNDRWTSWRVHCTEKTRRQRPRICYESCNCPGTYLSQMSYLNWLRILTYTCPPYFTMSVTGLFVRQGQENLIYKFTTSVTELGSVTDGRPGPARQKRDSEQSKTRFGAKTGFGSRRTGHGTVTKPGLPQRPGSRAINQALHHKVGTLLYQCYLSAFTILLQDVQGLVLCSCKISIETIQIVLI